MPQSPIQKIGRVVASPLFFFKRKFKAGGIPGSIFTLIAATLGGGTITLPYAVSQNGIIFGVFLIIMGAILSYYTGMLLVACGAKVDTDRYEIMAKRAYGEKMRKVVAVMIVICLIGFVISYIVFVCINYQVKSLVPGVLLKLCRQPDCQLMRPLESELFWATFGILLPLSIPRTVGALRFSSLLGFLCSVYLVVVVIVLFWTDKSLVEHPMENIKQASLFKVSGSGILNSMPLIIFSYIELQAKSYPTMAKVVMRGSSSAVFLYCLIGMFGYWTFYDKELPTNILDAQYDSILINIATIGLVIAIVSAAPLCMLPAKDGIEELFQKDPRNPKKFSCAQNFMITFLFTSFAYAIGITVPTIGDILTILGSTLNPLIGFTFPIIFYLKLCPEVPTYKKVIAHVVNIVMITMGILSLANFIYGKINDK